MRRNKFIAITFIIFLLIPLLDNIFHFSPVKELFEKRAVVKRPEFSLSQEYLQKFEKFFNDNYGMRKSLIFLNAQMSDKVFNESPDNRAIKGKDGWLYFDNYDSLLDASGKAFLSEKLINRGVESLYRNWQDLRAKNIDYLLVIAADKSTVYPEFLPSYIKVAKERRIDKLLDALRAKYPDFPILDLRPILLQAKKKEVVYHKTDTHWNKRGAHYAYVEMMKRLGIKPHLRKDFINHSDQVIRGDIADIMGIDATNIDYNLERKFKKKSREISAKKFTELHKPNLFIHKNTNLPRLFVYKDSFFGHLGDFVSEHFSQSLYTNEFPCDLNLADVKKFHPNLVIQQFWEGRVEQVLKNCKDNKIIK